MKKKRAAQSVITSNWKSCDGGNWSDANNWDNGVPNSPNYNAVFPDLTCSNQVNIVVDGSFDVGQISSNSENDFYTFYAPNHDSSKGVLTVHNSITLNSLRTYDPDELVSASIQFNSVTLQLANNLVKIYIAPNQGFAINSPVVGTGPQSSLLVSGPTASYKVMQTPVLDLSQGGGQLSNISSITLNNVELDLGFFNNISSISADLNSMLTFDIQVDNQFEAPHIGQLSCAGQLNIGGGTLMVDGNVQFSSTTIWPTLVSKGSLSLIVQGMMTLNNAVFTVEGDCYGSGTKQIVTAKGGVVGTFNPKVQSQSCVPTINYQKQGVSITW